MQHGIQARGGRLPICEAEDVCVIRPFLSLGRHMARDTQPQLTSSIESETRARRRCIEPGAPGRASGVVIPSQFWLGRCAAR